jgi:aldehyde dehydrogenase
MGRPVRAHPGRQAISRTPRRSPAGCSAKIARSDASDVELALDAAHKAKDAWGKTSRRRARLILNKIADRMEENLDLLALAETWDNGKPIRETTAADLPLAIDHFRYFAGVHARAGRLASRRSTTTPSPIISTSRWASSARSFPWNFPLLMACWKLAPALAAGNCVVLKPAEQTPASIMVLGRTDRRPAAARRAQHRQRLRPRGRQAAGQSNPRIAKIAFTGETTTGRLIMQYASQNLIPVTLELGGKSPNIFFADVMAEDDDFFDKAIEGFRHVRAQSGRGLHLPEPRAGAGEDLRPLHGARAQARRGDQAGRPARPRDDDRRAGFEPSSLEKILSYLDIGKQEGAKVLTGGERNMLPGDLAGGYYVKPTVFKGHNKMRIFQEEIFGPVVSVTTFKDETRRCRSPTTRSTASAPACGPATATAPTASAARSRPAASGPTATTPIRPMRPSAATSSPASAARTTR